MSEWAEREAELRADGWSDAEIREYRRGFDQTAEQHGGSRVSMPAASFDPRLDGAEPAVSYRALGMAEQVGEYANYLEYREGSVGTVFRSFAEPAETEDDWTDAADRAERLADRHRVKREQYRETSEGWAAYARRALEENGDPGALEHNKLMRQEMYRQAELRRQHHVQRAAVTYTLTDDEDEEVRSADVTVQTYGPLTYVSGRTRAVQAFIRKSRPGWFPGEDGNPVRTYEMTPAGLAQMKAVAGTSGR